MTIVDQAMVSAMSCPKEHDLQIGDKVTVLHRDYRGETGTIVKEETNMLNLPLVILKMDTKEGNLELCFYPNEVEKTDATKLS